MLVNKRKFTIIFSVIVIAVLAILFGIKRNGGKQAIYKEVEGTTVLSIECNNVEQVVEPWYCQADGIYYYFVPSFVKDYFDEEAIVEIKVNGETKKSKAICSENLPTMFINTESGSNDYILESDFNEEPGVLQTVWASGKTDFYGTLKKINGRGNSTWSNEDKKPFAITLNENSSLCGLAPGKKYALHAMCYEGDKMHSKFIYDMEAELGAEYTTGTTWTDVYLNGEYYGVYLLEEAHKVESGRINLPSSAILFQKASSDRTGDGSYFSIDDGRDFFLVEYPKDLSNGDLDYIKEIISIIDMQIHQGDFSNIDMESFAKCFLADELSMGYDAFKNSCYFYQKDRGEKLYAGPVWDYDLSFGETNFTDPKYADPTGTMIDARESQLDWYKILYENDEFREVLKSEFEKMLPWYRQMLDTTIDEQTEMINKAVNNDKLRWSNAPEMVIEKEENEVGTYFSVSVGSKSYRHPGGNYQDFRNDVKFFKYFLSARLNYFMDIWGVEGERFNLPKSGEVHTVEFRKRGQLVKEITVEDGDFIKDFPDDILEDDESWRMNWCMDVFNDKLPVYEDMILRSIAE